MRKRWSILFAVVVAFLIAGVIWYYKKTEEPTIKTAELQLDVVKKTHRIVVFVHGTFGSTLGLLDIPSVMKDNLKGSLYTKTARSMRKDAFFFCTQPLLGRGLRSFEPSFERSSDDGGFAVYPIGKSFEALAQHVWGDDELRYYYAFGWSGLLSQNKRRQEALRLLNELAEEVKKFNEQGIEPKITIIAHSHGANVVLNMGLLGAVLLEHDFSSISELENTDSMNKVRQLVASLPGRDQAAQLSSHKKWDYKPEKPMWAIEHLVMLGAPIQPETDYAVLSPLFKNVLHCYSHADRVQPNDWISTSRYYSDQRLDRLTSIFAANGKEFPFSVKQVRLLFGRDCDASGKLVYSTDGGIVKKKRTFWGMLVGDLSAPSRQADPTHKELWFMVFPQLDEASPLKPLPVSVVSPLLIKVMQQVVTFDCDCNLVQRGNDFCVEIAPYLDGGVQERLAIPYSMVQQLQKLASRWEVSSEFLAREESLLSSHVQFGRSC